jgi:hypothetical protein
MQASSDSILVNRAPVLTLWAAVVAERLGFDRDEALTLGRAVAGLNAQTKGRALGIFKPAPKALREQRRKLKSGDQITVELLGRRVPSVHTADGLRALSHEKPSDPAAVSRYLEKAFGDKLPAVRGAMARLAGSLDEDDLGKHAFKLYEVFRPEVPAGERGWGAKGILRLSRIATASPS